MEQPDLIMMQMERHPLNRPRFYHPYPVIFDIDDADFLWEHAHDIVIECIRDSAGVIAGSRYVAEYAGKFNPSVEVVWTGGPAQEAIGGLPQADRPNIVAWGHSRPLDYPAEAEFIQSVLIEVGNRIPVEYWIFGCDTNQDHSKLADRLMASGIKVRFHHSMSNEKFTQKLGEVAIGLQVLSDINEFSRGKSFGKILNYLCAGVVVVASNSAEHPLFFRNGVNGYLASSQSEWVDAITDLLRDPVRRAELSVNAFQQYKEQLTVRAAAAKYDVFFRNVVLKRGKQMKLA